MEGMRDVVRVQKLLGDLKELLAIPGREAERAGLGAQLTAWREEMERARPGVLAALTPDGREDLARRTREAQFGLEECLRRREKEKRALLARLLSCQAAQNTLNSYRRPPVRSFFSRTV